MSYENYYQNQCGRGDGHFYRGRRYQRGHGLGNILSGLIRAALPTLKRTAISVGKDILHTGLNQGGKVVQDIIKGVPIKQSVKRRALDGGKQIVNKRLKLHINPRHPIPSVKKRRAAVKKRYKDIFA